jgi:hypothetical protein
MIIPHEFELGGFKWTVKRVKRLKNKWGDCNVAKREIRILDTLDQQVKEQTFCHELMHAIEVALGVNPDDHEEQKIDARATFLHQYLNSAK